MARALEVDGVSQRLKTRPKYLSPQLQIFSFRMGIRPAIGRVLLENQMFLLIFCCETPQVNGSLRPHIMALLKNLQLAWRMTAQLC